MGGGVAAWIPSLLLVTPNLHSLAVLPSWWIQKWIEKVLVFACCLQEVRAKHRARFPLQMTRSPVSGYSPSSLIAGSCRGRERRLQPATRLPTSSAAPTAIHQLQFVAAGEWIAGLQKYLANYAQTIAVITSL